MSTSRLVLVILSTGLLSSFATAGLLLLLYHFVVRRSLERLLASAGDQVAERVRSGVLEAADEVYPRLRREVTVGVKKGADATVPKVRAEVAEGVREGLVATLQDGLGGAAGSEVVAETGDKVARAMVGAGLDLLFGKGEREGG
jgi:hypothetical protein